MRLFAGAALVDSKTADIVVTSVALLVVSELLIGDIVVGANVDVCNSVTLEISDESCDEDVTKLLLTSSVRDVSSLTLSAAAVHDDSVTTRKTYRDDPGKHIFHCV